MTLYHLLLLFCCLLFGCQSHSEFNLQSVLKENSALNTVINSDNVENIQIIITEVINNENGTPSFIDHTYQVDANQYYYPASTVKMPVAFLALEKLAEDSQLNKETPFKTKIDTAYTTIKQEVEKIFTVSDNAAYNRLYEWLGPDYINQKMHEKGLTDFRLSHRLSVPDAQNLETGNCIFKQEATDSMVTPVIQNTVIRPLLLASIKKGKGYFVNDSLVNEPFDFSLKNYYPLHTLHETTKRMFYPEGYDSIARFHIIETDRDWLYNSMSALPSTMGYDQEEFYDSYVKFFMYGDSKDKMPNHIKIHNKVGYAYGHLTDSAYIVDKQTGLSFIISATILVNQDQIFNDDVYEYEEVGIPFLAELGRAVYNKLYQDNKH